LSGNADFNAPIIENLASGELNIYSNGITNITTGSNLRIGADQGIAKRGTMTINPNEQLHLYGRNGFKKSSGSIHTETRTMNYYLANSGDLNLSASNTLQFTTQNGTSDFYSNQDLLVQMTDIGDFNHSTVQAPTGLLEFYANNSVEIDSNKHTLIQASQGLNYGIPSSDTQISADTNMGIDAVSFHILANTPEVLFASRGDMLFGANYISLNNKVVNIHSSEHTMLGSDNGIYIRPRTQNVDLVSHGTTTIRARLGELNIDNTGTPDGDLIYNIANDMILTYDNLEYSALTGELKFQTIDQLEMTVPEDGFIMETAPGGYINFLSKNSIDFEGNHINLDAQENNYEVNDTVLFRGNTTDGSVLFKNVSPQSEFSITASQNIHINAQYQGYDSDNITMQADNITFQTTGASIGTKNSIIGTHNQKNEYYGQVQIVDTPSVQFYDNDGNNRDQGEDGNLLINGKDISAKTYNIYAGVENMLIEAMHSNEVSNIGLVNTQNALTSGDAASFNRDAYEKAAKAFKDAEAEYNNY